MATMCGFQKMYTFLHLTFQEFLAACYVSDLEEKRQVELIEKYHSAIPMKQVWKFYCGLAQLNVQINSNIKILIQQTQHDSLFKVQCCFESQQPCACDYAVQNNSLSFVGNYLTPSDFTAIAYVISHSQEQLVMKFVLDMCTISPEGIDILVKKAHNKLSHIENLCYFGYDCVSEQLRLVNKLMHSLSSLEVLDISNTELGPEGVDCLTDNLNLRNLKIVKVGSPENSLYDNLGLSDSLANTFLSNCENLVNVFFSGNEVIPYLHCNLPLLNMSFHMFRPIEVRVLSEDLDMNPHCVRLTLNDCGINDEGVSCLVQGLKRCKNLEILELNCNYIGDGGADLLVDMIISCPNLCKLDLCCNRIGNAGAAAIATACTAKHVKSKVYFWGNNITDFVDIVSLYHKINFHTFEVSQSIENTGMESVSGVIKKLGDNCKRDLTTLNVGENRLSYDGIIFLAEAINQCKMLEVLDISYIYSMGNASLAILSETLQICTNLQSLCLCSIDIGSIGAKVLVDALKHLRNLFELDISYNGIENEGVYAIGDGLKYLRVLNISCCNITGVEALAHALRNCSNLHKVIMNHSDSIWSRSYGIKNLSDYKYFGNLHELHVRSSKILDDSVEGLAKILVHCVNLEVLDISDNFVRRKGAEILAKTLECCPKLRKLEIRDNNLGKLGVIELSSLLKVCTNIEVLDVSFDTIEEYGACVLADGLKLCTDLHTLLVGNCGIGNGGAKALADALKHCTNLRELDVCNNSIRFDGTVALADMLKFCKDLKKLNISDNDIGVAGCKALTKSLQHCTKLCVLNIDSIGDEREDCGLSDLRTCCCNLHVAEKKELSEVEKVDLPPSEIVDEDSEDNLSFVSALSFNF